jgi:hypothetical protein
MQGQAIAISSLSDVFKVTICDLGPPVKGKIPSVRFVSDVLTGLPHCVRVHIWRNPLRDDAFFRIQRYSDVPLWSHRRPGDEERKSRDRLEEEIQVQSQLPALPGQVDRLHRGAP